MDEQRKRVQELDEINALLDDPVNPPTMQLVGATEEKPAWPYDVFLRLPKGYGTSVKDKAPYYVNFAFFRYTGDDPRYNIFLVAATIVEKDAQQEPGKYTRANFLKYVRSAIEDYYVKTTKSNPQWKEEPKERSDSVKQFLPYPSESKLIHFATFEYVEKLPANHPKGKELSVFRVHIHQDGDRQFAIVEHRPYAVANEAHDKAFRACLRTLDIGPDAAAKRNQFKKARG